MDRERSRSVEVLEPRVEPRPDMVMFPTSATRGPLRVEPSRAEAPDPAGLEDFAPGSAPEEGHPTPSFWVNPYAEQIDRLLKTHAHGATAGNATHEAILAGGHAVETGAKPDHDDARALHGLAAEAHRAFCRNFNPEVAEHSNRLADLHDQAAAWHGERGTVFAKPEDFLTPESTDAFYVRAYGTSHPPQRLETEQQMAGTHEVRDGQHKLKVPEPLRDWHRLEARVIRKEHIRPGRPEGNPYSASAWDLSSEGNHKLAWKTHDLASGYYKGLAMVYESTKQTQNAISADEGAELHDRTSRWHRAQLLEQGAEQP